MKILFIALAFQFNVDKSIYEWFLRQRHEDMTTFMEITSATANSENYFLFLSTYALFGSEKNFNEIKVTTASMLFTGLLTLGIKFLTNRARPEGKNGRENSSFPSGHTSGAFAFSHIIGNYHPNYRIPLFIWAFAVGISRIYLGRHWATDCIAGAFLGLSISEFIYRKRIIFEKMEVFP